MSARTKREAEERREQGHWADDQTCSDPANQYFATEQPMYSSRTHCTALHGDTALLLVLARVEETELAGHTRRDDVVGTQQRVGKRRLAVVNVRDNGYILRGVVSIVWAEGRKTTADINSRACSPAARRMIESPWWGWKIAGMDLGNDKIGSAMWRSLSHGDFSGNDGWLYQRASLWRRVGRIRKVSCMDALSLSLPSLSSLCRYG